MTLVGHNFAGTLTGAMSTHKERVAIIEHSNSEKFTTYSFEEMQSKAIAFAQLFLDMVPQDRSVAIFMRRSADGVAAMIGAIIAGRTFYCVNPQLSSVQILQMAKTANTSLLVFDPSVCLKMVALSKNAPEGLSLAICADDPLNAIQEKAIGQITAKSSLILHRNNKEQVSVGHLPKQRLALMPIQLLFTSGSTGTPRAVALDEADVLERVLDETDAFGILPRDTLLNLLPFSFDVGCNQLYTALLNGSTLVISNSWLAKDILGALETHNISGVSGVPILWQSLLDVEPQKARSATESLRYLTISGGSLSLEQQQKLQRLLPAVEIFKTYGQTETFRSGMLFPSELTVKPNSIGKPPQGVQVAIVSDDGTQAKPFEMGEIIHAGTGTMIGYYGDAGHSDQKLKAAPDWFGTRSVNVVFTGDRGHLDDEGYLYLSGRMDRMMKIRGNRVYPEEVESQLIKYPGICDVVVVAGKVPDTLSALMICADNDCPTDLQLRQFAGSCLPSYMIPTHFRMIAEIPKTSTGKSDLTAATFIAHSEPEPVRSNASV